MIENIIPNPALRTPHEVRRPLMSNAQLGMMLLIGSLTVLFACFISAYMVLRMSAPMWPPPGAPMLPRDLSIVNTSILVVSAIIAAISGRKQGLLPIALALGVVFVIFQIVEFQRLYARGLTLRTGAYGAVFYTLIGCHAIHVIGGLIGFATALRNTARAHVARIYWYFVTAVWLVLFGILYIV